MFERWFRKLDESLFISYSNPDRAMQEWKDFKKHFETIQVTQTLEIIKIEKLTYSIRIYFRVANRIDKCLEKIKEALEYYADPFHYEKHCSENGKDIEEILLDKGRIANAILMELENDISGSSKKD